MFGAEHVTTLATVMTLANLHNDKGAFAAARSTYEEVAGVIGTDITQTINGIINHGCCLLNIGDLPAAIARQKEAVTLARRVLGEAHPTTQQAAGMLAQCRERVAEAPPSACAAGILVGRARAEHGIELHAGGRPELNGKTGFVVGFDSGRYRVRLEGSAPSCRTRHAGAAAPGAAGRLRLGDVQRRPCKRWRARDA